jgi:undecaprenyldiphospho-muramoylpentapeptide beta-N-acetylglucosaminyltransferase
VGPAIAVGRALVERGHTPESIHFIGARRGIEGRLVPEAGFEVTLLPGRGVERRLTARNLAALGGMAVAALRGVALVARHRPAVIVSVGGYASFPGVLAAAVLRVPMVVVEQNAAPGAANRVAARVARAAAVAFPGTELPRAVVTGNPVRREVLAVDRSPAGRAVARERLGLPADATVIVAFGGSLCARTINRAVLALAGQWRDRGDLAIYHVVGTRDWDMISAQCPEWADGGQPAGAAGGQPAGAAGEQSVGAAGGLWYRQVRYEDQMEVVYAAADIAVCRAGASTVSELAAIGLPAVLIPLPGAPNDHQTANARALVTAGGARLVPDTELTADRLRDELARLADPAVRAAMAQGAASVAHRGAAAEVAELVERVSRG